MAAAWKLRKIRKFLDFVPGWKKKAPTLDLSNVPTGKGKEKPMYKVVNTAITDSGCIPKYEMVDTSDHPDAISGTKPDGILIPQGFLETKISDSSKSTPSNLNYMRYADIVFEMKPCTEQDGFNDTEEGSDAAENEQQTMESASKAGIKTRGQLIDYATDIMSLQHRVFAFTVTLIGTIARITRWDRSGAVVSTAFDYADPDDNFLGEFLWRYTHASRAEQGFDTTVTEASAKEVSLFERSVLRFLDKVFIKGSSHRTMLEDTLDSRWPTSKMTVVDEKTKVVTHYIVRRPFSEVLSPCGRSTRGYLAYSLDLKRIVFLKDTWRTEDEGVPSEAEAYNTLRALGIPCLPHIIASGDVKSGDQIQETWTDRVPGFYEDDDDDGNSDDDEDSGGSDGNHDDDKNGTTASEKAKRSAVWFRRHIHHRVVQDVALPIQFARSTKELVQAFRNVLYTIWKAHEDGHLLHRDISAGNIMLNEKFEGMLNDWDHSVWVPLRHMPRDYRTGTWAFMSIELLDYHPKLHSLLDDIESCYWVLLFIASKYFEGGLASDDTLFDQCRELDNTEKLRVVSGGEAKFAHFGSWAFTRLRWKSLPLTRVVHAFGTMLATYHSARTNPMRLHKSAEKKAAAEEALKEARESVENVKEILEIFDEAIASDDWPTVDVSMGEPQMQTETEKFMNNFTALRHTRSTLSGTNARVTPALPVIPAASNVQDSATEGLDIGSHAPRARRPQGSTNPHFSTGEKRTLPDDNEDGNTAPMPSGDSVRNKRARKGKDVARAPVVRTRTRSQARSVIAPTQGPSRTTRSRTNSPEGSRAAVSNSRGNDQETHEATGPTLPRRSTRSQTRTATRDADNFRPTAPLPRRVTRSSSRNMNAHQPEENVPAAALVPRTRTRAKSANGRL